MTWEDDHFVAGDAALDFANTVFRRRPELGSDLLTDTAVLAEWLRRAGVVAGVVAGEQEQADGAGVDLVEARQLRALLWELFDACVEGRDLPGAALASVFEVLRRGLGDGGLVVSAEGVPTVRGSRHALAAVALRAVKLMVTPGGPPIRTCDRCGWFFLDASRGRRRRWCSMKTCGNQAKAARYRSAHA
ncbi:CGNR zinc finger domain-containing protein [Pseudonocardia sp. TRM90224]|uniref:CGNR zinc finger domain-containing protein n=1 Tax=Pseudonocardia sp. TRM90224 TaxID=2812678 RepID=UPI001E3B68B2|nr:CGNR zinc finger domain-containing protein [Pseudonocardia sp. TRM90224]